MNLVKITKAAGSLPVAILLITLLALLLVISTFLESLHGTSFAQKNFYNTRWFDLVLLLVWFNMFFAALSRWPFQKKHTGFVITHIGILMLLVGAFLSRALGVEGQMALFEGEEKGRIQLGGAEAAEKILEGPPGAPSNHAVEAVLMSERAGIQQELFLVENGENELNLGPARFALRAVPPDGGTAANDKKENGAVLHLIEEKTGKEYLARILEKNPDIIALAGSDLKITDVHFYPHAKIENKRIIEAPDAVPFNPAIEFKIFDAKGQKEEHTKFALFPHFPSLRGGQKNNVFGLLVYLEAKMPEGLTNQNRASFTFLYGDKENWKYKSHSPRSGDDEGNLTEGAKIPTGWMDMQIEVKKLYARAKPNSATVPFFLKLLDFRKVDYPGTNRAASFESDVVLSDPSKGLAIHRTIQMNKPLDYRGWRIFQASYMQDPEGGEGSVFSVAKNPGIPFIYGAAAIVFVGVVLLFYLHPFFKRVSRPGDREAGRRFWFRK